MFPVTITLSNQHELSVVLAALNAPAEDRQLSLPEETSSIPAAAKVTSVKKTESVRKPVEDATAPPFATEEADTDAQEKSVPSGESESQPPEESRSDAAALIRKLAKADRNTAVAVLGRYDAGKLSEIPDARIPAFCEDVRSTLKALELKGA